MSNGTNVKVFLSHRHHLTASLRRLWIHSGLQCEAIDGSSRFCESLDLGRGAGFRGATVEVWGREDVRIIDATGVEVWGSLFVTWSDSGNKGIVFEPHHIDADGFGLEDIETAVGTAADLARRLRAAGTGAADADGRFMVARAAEAIVALQGGG